MKFRFVWVGKTRDKNWKALQDEYLNRLSHFLPCNVAERRERRKGEDREAEGEQIIKLLDPKGFMVLLDVGGEPVTSHGLAKRIEEWQNRGLKEVAFVIGGADGVSPAVAERANDRLSLSFLTFTHEMARVVLLEQLYRAFTITRGYPYQK